MADELRLIFDSKNPRPDRYTGVPNAQLRPSTAEEAKDLLVRGNRAFADFMELCVSGEDGVVNLYCNEKEIEGGGPDPFAAVIGCIDARVPTEMALSQGFNALFTVRTAGNTLARNGEGKGSIRYSLRKSTPKVGASKGDEGPKHNSLLAYLVLGHLDCGAVSAAVDAFNRYRGELPDERFEYPELIAIFEEIYAAIRDVVAAAKVVPNDPLILDEIAAKNAQRSARRVKSMLDQMVETDDPSGEPRIEKDKVKVYYSMFNVDRFTIIPPIEVRATAEEESQPRDWAKRFAEQQSTLRANLKLDR